MNNIFLVTGAAGFIGSHICEELLNSPENIVIGIDNFYSGKQENISLLQALSTNFIFYELDIREFEELDAIVKRHKVDYIFHEAAIASVQTSVDKPAFTHEVNVKGSINILETARLNLVKRLVFASSAAVYGDEPTLPKNESSPTKPISPYGLEKLIIEQYMSLYAELYNLECVALRYFNVYGPRQDPTSEYSGVISIFDNRIKQGLPITIFGDGEQYRDFIYVKDVAVINLKVMFTDLKHRFEVFCVGTGIKSSIKEVVEVLAKRHKLDELEINFQQERPGDIKKSVSENFLLLKIVPKFKFSEIYHKL